MYLDDFRQWPSFADTDVEVIYFTCMSIHVTARTDINLPTAWSNLFQILATCF